MSWQAMIWAHKICAGLSATEYRTLMVLAEHARDDGTDSRPCVATIAREGEMSERTVQRSIAALRDYGLISTEVEATWTRPATFRINMKLEIKPKIVGKGAKLAVERGDKLAAERRQADAEGVTTSPEGVTGCREGGDTLSPEPLREPLQEPVQEPTRASARDPVSQLVEAWNEVAQAEALSTIVVMSPSRVKHARARLAEHGLPGVLEAIAAVGLSDFCRGKNDRSWKADFDFVLQARSCARLREGFYANRSPAGRNGQPSKYAQTMQAFEDELFGGAMPPPHPGPEIEGVPL